MPCRVVLFVFDVLLAFMAFIAFMGCFFIDVLAFMAFMTVAYIDNTLTMIPPTGTHGGLLEHKIYAHHIMIM